MSRVGYDDGEGIPYEMWAHNARLAVTGRPGQKALRELEAALVAMPIKRLIDTHICQDGEVCALGSLALARKRSAGSGEAEALDAVRGEYLRAARLAGYRPERDWVDDDPDPTISMEFGKDVLGMTRTLAWVIVDLNDETCAGFTPEMRWERVLAWVRDQIAEAV